MAFQFTYNDVVRKPNPMSQINPLKRGTGKVVTLEDRLKDLANSYHWNQTENFWINFHRKIDPTRIPKVEMVELGKILIDEDIQRALDPKHCATKIADPNLFDPALLQTLQCIKTSDAKFISIDGQHTASVLASLIACGRLEGVTDWKTYKFPVQYIETDSLSYARRAFSILNGKGKKKQSQYQQLRNSVFIVRIDNDQSDDDDVNIERKVAIAEKYNCFPIELNSPNEKYPGTFTNIATFKTLSDREIEMACKWHDTYFHYEGVHVSLFFIMRDLSRQFASAKIPITDKLLEELASLVQSLFINLSQFQESVTEAHRQWTTKRYGYQAAWDDDAYACALIQLYVKFGGEEKIAPTLLDRFDTLIDYFDEDLLELAA